MNKLPRWTGWVVLGVALAAGAGFAFKGSLARDVAPPVRYVLLDGSHHESQQAWAGKVMLVNFWATSCTTCVKEMPEVVATYQKYKDKGFDTLAVAMSYDPPAYVANFAESRQLPFKVAMDSTGDIARSFGQVQLTPTTFLINKRGEIVKRFVGEPDFNALHATIEKLLAES
ncbi:TlpA disulfide reductase family protein [Roseateles depolymerans]|uniref:Redoxin domain-containing protein n=1 Tax=Roseateles depolymerans TaxID=76731 RepID=A0A0U3N0R0_9BURK|nr:TlpA disulfide reductase family protein [Roseateles depolymerans]ALV08883.1 Redoxin domain-containing protein [Roseateles depolymerans]REG09455.1 peroxiredoxin [Roseateles depolymerans]